MSLEPVTLDYDAMREEIFQIVEAGKVRARRAVEGEKVRTYWEIGRAIHGYLQMETLRAEYGAEAVERLGGGLGMGREVSEVGE